MLRVLAAALVLALAPAAGAATAREQQVAGPISSVAAAGIDVAYADQYRRGCHEVRLWNVATRGDRRLASHCFVSTSTGSGVAGAIATQGRALWLTYTGGNIREWSLWTKGSLTTARRIAFLAADVDGPPPVILGSVWESSLPYAIGRTIIVLAPNGSRRFSLTAADRVVYLSAHSRGYAVVLANGRVLSISPAGKLIRERTFAPGAAQTALLAAPGLIVETPAGLQIHGAVSVRTVALPPGARLLGYSEGIAAYGIGRELRLRRLANGSDRLFRRLEPRFHAQLGRRGIGYGSGRTLGFSVWAIVSGAV
ncbi:MAG TPA: hypothetical protein VEW11_05800 [Gaiellaceae bacterium]|nr:hypothetical protein [Gaiellaceae bacterium]